MGRVGSNLPARILIYLIFELTFCSSVDWDRIKCAQDLDQRFSDGRVDIGRFSWVGAVLHTFRLAERDQYAVTTGVLIHPGYAIASADDIAKIPREKLSNNTKLILWYSEKIKYSLDVMDYLLHPEYEEKVTFATLALLELSTFGETGLSDMKAVILPACLPLSNYGTFDHMYGVRIFDDEEGVNKELMEMNYVPTKECDEFYYNTQLSFELMRPRKPLCARAAQQKDTCVWDAGVALVARQTYIHWTLLGFSVRGAGCGAPARFLSIRDYIPWIDGVLDQLYGTDTSMVKLAFRRQNPHKLTMYAADVKLPKEIGECERSPKVRGVVQYKENDEVVTTKNFAQGYYFVSVQQVMSVICVTVTIESLARTNTAVWIEHICHKDAAGIAYTSTQGADIRREECFAYFKTSAYVEFRFFFSFRAMFEVTMYGFEDHVARPAVPNPFSRTETTDPWWPTGTIIADAHFETPSTKVNSGDEAAPTAPTKLYYDDCLISKEVSLL